MKQIIVTVILVVFFVAGVGGAFWYINQNKQSPSETTDIEPATENTASENTGGGGAHGHFPQIPAGAEMCSTHRVPDIVCPFCNPDNIENFGHCGGHDVPEALCTRCHPILIAAFQAEGDWCAEHNVPESQCQQCAAEKG